MIYGYARVSTKKQNLVSQLHQLKSYGCDKIYAEKVTGVYKKKKNREQWELLARTLKDGDTLVVTKLDRLGRTTLDILLILEYLQVNNIRFVSLNENYDTFTPQGKVFMNIAAIFAELERDTISERTKEGLVAAKLQGRIGGRPRISKWTAAKMYTMYHCHCYSIREICEECNISKPTLYRYLNYYYDNPKDVPDLSLFPLLPADERPEAPVYMKKGRPSIPPDVISKIQSAYSNNISKSEISRMLNISYATVDKYCKCIDEETSTKDNSQNNDKVSD